MDLIKILEKKYPSIGVCGLDCGLCPRYYTAGPSICPGCAGPGFHDKHPSCSFITCCVKNRGLEVCAECPEFPCVKFKSEEEYKQGMESSSYPSYKKVYSNFNFIKEYGIEKFIEHQNKRIRLLEIMLKNYDDGRSKSFFCRAAIFHDTAALEVSIEEAEKAIMSDKIDQTDMKSKARILKAIIEGIL